MAKVKQPKKTDIEKILSKEELEMLAGSFDYERHNNYWHRNKYIFQFLLNTGLRVGESSQLKIFDVMSPNGQVKDVLLVRGETAKRKKTRHIPLNDLAKEAVRKLIDKRNVEFSDSLFVHLDGKTPMTARALQNMVGSSLKKAGITRPFSIHGIRHTALSHLFRKTNNLPLVSRIAGHNSTHLTASLYCHPSMEELAEGMKKLVDMEDR